MRSGRTAGAIFFLLLNFSWAFCQNKQDPYFFPVRPGQRNFLSGTMGEIRATHFHTGIDIKTSGITGLKVYATHAGYVSRLRIGPSGYGNCLYITDPDGEIAVYGHLSRFRDDIQEYALKEQYKKQSFNVYLFPPKTMFPVKEGEFIALSGNSGSTTGPHLHFELRNSDEDIINPLEKGFKEITDDIPPVVQAFALKTLNIHSRVNDQFGNFIFTPFRVENVFRYDTPIRVHGLIGIEVQAHDKLSGAANRDGIPFISVYLDGKEVMNMDLTSFSLEDASNTPVYYDNKLKKTTRKTFQKLFIDDGNTLPFYKNDINKGKLNINDTLMHQVMIVFRDLSGNESYLNFHLKGGVPRVKQKKKVPLPHDPITWEVDGNTLVINNSKNDSSSSRANLYFNSRIFELIPAYTFPDKSVFLWDLRRGLPDSVRIDSNLLSFNFRVAIPEGSEYTYFNPYFELKANPHSFYDTVYLTSKHSFRDIGHVEQFMIGNDNIPLDGHIQIKFHPGLSYNDDNQYGVYYTSNFKTFSFLGNNWNNNTISIKSSDLGDFVILKDSLPPQITPMRINENRASFRIKDDLSGIYNISASIDGKWLLMNYDPKKNLIWSDRLEKNIPLNGEFNLEVTDNCGNVADYKTKIE